MRCDISGICPGRIHICCTGCVDIQQTVSCQTLVALTLVLVLLVQRHGTLGALLSASCEEISIKGCIFNVLTNYKFHAISISQHNPTHAMGALMTLPGFARFSDSARACEYLSQTPSLGPLVLVSAFFAASRMIGSCDPTSLHKIQNIMQQIEAYYGACFIFCTAFNTQSMVLQGTPCLF